MEPSPEGLRSLTLPERLVGVAIKVVLFPFRPFLLRITEPVRDLINDRPPVDPKDRREIFREIFTLIDGLAEKTEEEQRELVGDIDRLFEQELGTPFKY